MTSEIQQDRCRIAIQKSGRLSEESYGLLKGCGITFTKSRDQLFCHGGNYPLDILLVRDDDIPELVSEGICDLGIVGDNVLQEKLLSREYEGRPEAVTFLQTLDFGHCRLSLAVPTHFDYQSPKDLQDTTIATTYPALLRHYLTKQGVHAKIVELSGSVEIAPRLGVAKAICDLVSTGTTLKANGLKEAQAIFQSQAQLIQTKGDLSSDKQAVIHKLLRRIAGVKGAKESKYILLHAPKNKVAAITALLPGAEHPTVLPLAGSEDHVAIHALCSETVFWETMEQLKEVGASTILVVPVEKMLA